MILTIDIGNTNLTLGLYEGDQLGAHWRLATDHNRMPDEYGLQFLGLLQNAGKTLKDIHGISLASVVPPSDRAGSSSLPRISQTGAVGCRYRRKDGN